MGILDFAIWHLCDRYTRNNMGGSNGNLYLQLLLNVTSHCILTGRAAPRHETVHFNIRFEFLMVFGKRTGGEEFSIQTQT